MKKMSTTQTVLVAIFSLLLVACLTQYITHNRATERAKDQAQAQVNPEAASMAEQTRAFSEAMFAEKAKIVQRGEEMDKRGLHGEERTKEVERQQRLAEQELRRIESGGQTQPR